MNMGWKEIKKNKARFIILGSIVFLVSFLTLIISGLSNGLAQDNAALIKNLTEGTFYLNEDADETYNLSKIEDDVEEKLVEENEDATPMSIQIVFVDDKEDNQLSVAFVTVKHKDLFPEVQEVEVILDESLKDKGVKVGDIVTNNQLSEDLKVTCFVEQEKFSHSPVAFINPTNYQEMYRMMEMQMVFVPEKNHETEQS